jgi:tetratricopeptide (TPR) repeat protein
MPENRTSLTLASHYLDIDQPERTLEILDHPDSDVINHPYFWYLRGQAFYRLEKFESARQAAQKGLALAPQDVQILLLLCNCQSRLKNLAEAERAILAALQQAPENPQLICRYARLVAEGGQLDKSERLLQKAEQIDPEHTAVQHLRVLLAFLRGNDNQAIAASETALLQNPEDSYAHFMKGQAQASQGQVNPAARHFQQAARLEPMEQTFRSTARTSRYWTHWLLWPLQPLYRFGTVKVWLAAIVIILGLQALGFDRASGYFALAYLVLVVYSWVMPPLLRWWLKRQHGGGR